MTRSPSSAHPLITLPRLSRRSLLAGLGTAAAAVGTGGLAGCGAGGTVTEQAATVDEAVLPSYLPLEYLEPDLPSVNGSVPGFLSWPEDPARGVATPPGDGRTIRAMTPLWGPIPNPSGNKYYEAVNGLIGNTVDFEITDGNVYGDKLATVLASPRDVPDWVSIPSWNFPPRFGTEIVENVFADLTPYLSGDKVTQYPHLANLPTDAWRMCVFNGKLFALPYPDNVIRDLTFYRDDLLSELGIEVDVRSGDDLLALAQEITDPGANRWAAEDLWITATQMYAVPPQWRLDGDRLVHRVETEEYRAALEFNLRLFEAGVVHPDAVAGQDGEKKQRFQSGRSLIYSDGLGGWPGALQDNLSSNPDYSQTPFLPFAADGGEPLVWKGPAAGMFSFVKQTDDTSMIEQILATANVLAAPFGTLEYQTVNYGVEGEHFTRDASGAPQLTELAARELQSTYIHLVDPPVVEARVQFPGFVEALCGWMAEVTQYVVEPPFYGLQVSEPAQFAALSQPFEDLEADIPRGRRSLADLDTAIETWRSSGGEELRAFYRDLLDRQ